MGGTFDPVHIGHLVVASEAVHALGLDLVLFVPAARPWQKAAEADPEDRFVMTVLGTGDHPRFAVSRTELDRPGPTYSVDTLEQLSSFYGAEVELLLIAGSDTVAHLDTWHRAGDVARLARIVSVARPGHEPGGAKVPSGQVTHLDVPGIDVSSTEIRERVRAGRPIDYLVPAAVARYISAAGLYLDAGGGDA